MNKNRLTLVLSRGWMNKMAVVFLLLLATSFIFATVQTNCVYFPRLSGNYIATQVSLAPGDFTMEAWVYPMEPLMGGDPDRLEIFGGHLGGLGNSGYDFGTNVSRNVVFRNRTSAGVTITTGNATLPLFTWSHVAVIWGTGGTSPNGIYINGVFDQAINLVLDSPLPVLGFKLGQDSIVLNLYKGRMDEFRHWSCKREQADIVANMNLSLTSPQPNLLQSYPFSEGSNTVTRNYAVPMNPGQFAMLGNSIEWVGSPTPPTVTTQAATLVSEDSATLNGTLIYVGSDYPWLGFVWNTTGNPTITSPMVDPYQYWGPVNTTGPFSYSLTGLTAGQTYYVRAFGSNNGGLAYGGEISFTTTSSGLSAPIATAATAITTGGFTTNWNEVAGASSYRLDVSTEADFGSFVTGYNDLNVGNVSTYAVTGLAAGSLYHYRVRAANATLTSPSSNAVSATTLAAYNVNISTGNISGVRIYSNLADYGIDPAMPIVLAAGYTGTFSAEKDNYVFSLMPGSDSNIINNLDSGRNITFNGTFIYTDPAGFQYTADSDIPLDAQPGNLAGLTVPIPVATPPDANVVVFTGSTNTDIKIDLPAGSWFVLAYYDDPLDGGLGWHRSSSYPQNGPGFVTFANLPFGANNEIPVIISNQDVTLPVVLSSFNAVLTANLNVNLTWVTESETDVRGYNVFRSGNGNIAEAQRINPIIIQATNTTQQHIYSFTDAEVEVGGTYYYWMENVDMNGMTGLHGPRSVTVTGNTAPVLPESSVLNNIYPNPFRSGQTSNISISVKDGDIGTVTIYNFRGQAVKSFEVAPGNHNLTWNGHNYGSGIYFVKLSTNSVNSVKRLVIIK